MIETSSLEKLQFASDEIHRLGEKSEDAVAFLKQAFLICCRNLGIQNAAYWVMPQGQLSVVGSLGFTAREVLELVKSQKALQNRLQETFQKQKLNWLDSDPDSHRTIALSSLVRSTESPLTVASAGLEALCDNSETRFLLLPIRGLERAKTVLTFWMNSSEEALKHESTPRWNELAQCIEQNLDQVVIRARSRRPQQSWTQISANTKSTTTSTDPIQALPLKIVVSPNASSETDGGRVLDLQDPRTTATALIQAQERLLQLARIVGRRIDEKSVAYDVVNELRAYLGVGRIGLSYVHGSRSKLQALSGIESFDKRSGIVLAINSLCDQVAKSRNAIWDPEQSQGQPKQLCSLLERYYEISDSHSIAVIPIFTWNQASTDPDDLAAAIRNDDEGRGELLALLSIEGIQESIQKSDVLGRWSAAEPIVSNAIHNARRYSGIFLFPVWQAISDLRSLFRGHHRNKAIAASTAILLCVALLAFMPGQLRLKAEGVIQPIHRSRIYSEVSGTVANIQVHDGMRVVQGDTLLQLMNPELDIEFAKVEGDCKEAQQALVAIRDQLNSSQTVDESSSRLLRKERASLEEKIQSLQNQMSLLELKRSKLKVISPRDGQVITWDILQRLGRRPIEPGQHLMTVAEDAGPWELELRLPDKLTGYLRKAIQQNQSGKPLEVQFVLASEPTKVHRGSLRRLADSNHFDDEEGSILRVYVDLDPETKQWIHSVKPGTEVIAHIQAGQHSQGYCLFYEFLDWVNRIWFKYSW